jgi:hypothetical protein
MQEGFFRVWIALGWRGSSINAGRIFLGFGSPATHLGLAGSPRMIRSKIVLKIDARRSTWYIVRHGGKLRKTLPSFGDGPATGATGAGRRPDP